MNNIEENLKYLFTLKTINLATINNKNQPCISYAPYLFKNGNIYLLLSPIAEHFDNIINNQNLSGLVIESDTAAQNLFLKKRLDIQLRYLNHSKKSPILEDFVIHHGDFVNTLLQMDFYFFELEITGSKLVYGAAKAFELDKNFNLIKQKTGVHSEFPNFKYQGKIYYLVSEDSQQNFINTHQSSYQIQTVLEPKRITHIFEHFINDFGYTGELGTQKILVLTPL